MKNSTTVGLDLLTGLLALAGVATVAAGFQDKTDYGLGYVTRNTELMGFGYKILVFALCVLVADLVARAIVRAIHHQTLYLASQSTAGPAGGPAGGAPPVTYGGTTGR